MPPLDYKNIGIDEGGSMFILDLFSGAGGLAEGFISEGFIPVAHVEMDRDAINTLHTRITYHYLKRENKLDIYIKYLDKKISRDDLYKVLPLEIADTVIHDMLSADSLDSICQKIDINMKRLNCSDLDVLIGGPPCQTYSLISRSTKNYQNENDQRNHLYKLYAKILKRYRPKFFVFENVPGLKSVNGGTVLKELLSIISEQGYTVDLKELDASDFGVLQKRTRIIITGWRKEYSLNRIEYEHKTYKNAVVNDLLTDLVPIKPGEENNKYISEPTPYLFESGLRSIFEIPLTQHMCRYHNENDREIYRIAIRLWNEEGKRLVYSNLPHHLITRKNPHVFTDKYKVVAGNAPYSHTIIAHIAKDGHYYIHPDIEQARSISVREAARLQSFPDDYFFEGSRLKVFTQIGNAVPPLMAKQIARTIKEALSNVR
jgi:DNA (cytosine-5)-methyltransferase 1